MNTRLLSIRTRTHHGIELSIGFLIVSLLVPGAMAADTMHARSLRCEYLHDPLGTDVVRPRLSWTLEADGRNRRQTAYQIMVASSRDRLSRNEADLWDS